MDKGMVKHRMKTLYDSRFMSKFGLFSSLSKEAGAKNANIKFIIIKKNMLSPKVKNKENGKGENKEKEKKQHERKKARKFVES